MIKSKTSNEEFDFDIFDFDYVISFLLKNHNEDEFMFDLVKKLGTVCLFNIFLLKHGFIEEGGAYSILDNYLKGKYKIIVERFDEE